jgi:hypothetical protein
MARTFAQKPHEYICAEGALVCFIKNDHAVPIQVALVQGLSQKDTISHNCHHIIVTPVRECKKQSLRTLDLGVRGGTILEPNRVTYRGTELALHLLADSLGNRHCGNTTGLRTADHTIRAVAVLV